MNLLIIFDDYKYTPNIAIATTRSLLDKCFYSQSALHASKIIAS